MKKNHYKQIIVLIFALVGIIYRFYSEVAPKDGPQHKRSRIVLTKHAKCRMACRHIDLDEIKLVLEEGKINAKKSEPSKKPCPVNARELAVHNQNIRVISADCGESQTIITVIDLGREYQCDCP